VVHLPADLFAWPNAIVSALMLPLSTWIVLSGVDDLTVDLAAVAARLRNRSRQRPKRRSIAAAEPSRIAVFVPCWKEDKVLAAMVEGNRQRIRYAKYDFFLGAYPNDDATIRIAEDLSARYENVHLALCPHDGPTSKADCLNWVWQRMLAFETASGVRFDVVVTHDAEDVIHPDALLWINWYAREYEMVQVPVLPLPTAVTKFTHGV
jgi:adsorption protein B